MRNPIQSSARDGLFLNESKPLTLVAEKSIYASADAETLRDMDLVRDEISLSLFNGRTGNLERILTDKNDGFGNVWIFNGNYEIGRVNYGVIFINEGGSEIDISYVSRSERDIVTLEPKSVYTLAYNNGWTRICAYTTASVGGDNGIYRGKSPNEVVYLDEVSISDTQKQYVSYFPMRHVDGYGPDPSMLFRSLDYTACNFDIRIYATKNDGNSINHVINDAHNVFEYLYNNGFPTGDIPLHYVLQASYTEFGGDEYNSWWGQLAPGSIIKIGFERSSGSLPNAGIVIKLLNDNKFFSGDQHIMEFPLYIKNCGSPIYSFESTLLNSDSGMWPTSFHYESIGNWSENNAALMAPEKRFQQLRHKFGQKFLGDVHNPGSEVPVIEKMITGRLLYRGTLGIGYNYETIEGGYRYYSTDGTWLYNSKLCRPGVLFISNDMDNGVTPDTFYDGTSDGFYYTRPIIEYVTEEAYYNYGPPTSGNAYTVNPNQFSMSTDPYFDPVSIVDWSKSGPIVSVAIRKDSQWFVPLQRRYGENCSIFHFDGNDGQPDIATEIIATTATFLTHEVFSNDKVHYVKLLISNNDSAVDLLVKPNRRNAPTMTLKPGEYREFEIHTEAHADNPNNWGVNCRVWFDGTPTVDASVTLTEIGIGQESPSEMEWVSGSL